ncbi:root UVB sensitive, partial [Thalictrum thalictroides]
CVDCNREENILTWERFLKPQIVLGASVEEIIGGERSSSMVQNLLKLYAREKYILVVRQDQIDFKVFISFKVGATSQSVLRSLWQTYWLHEHWEESNNVFDQLTKSLFHLEERFDHFLQLLEEAGWDVHKLKLKVPKNVVVEETGPTDSLKREWSL